MTDQVLLLKLLFQFSSSHFDTKAEQELLLLDKTDSANFTALAIQNGMAGFVYKNLASSSTFPAHLKNELKAVYRETVFQNLRQLAEVIKILQLLSEKNINVIPLKGVIASEILFHDLGVYPSGDIDILVHPSDLSTAKSFLLSQGYKSIEGIREKDLLTSHYHLMFHNGQYLLEVHWNLTKRYVKIPPEFWWHDVNTIHWRDMDVLELAPEKYILYTIFRLYDHCFYPSRFFILITGIIRNNSQTLQWESLMAYARRHRMKRMTLFTLQFLHEFHDTQMPEDILKKRIIGSSILKKLVISGIAKGIERKHLRMMVYTTLLDSPTQILSVLLRRLFPPKGELCLRYNLQPDSPWIWFYFLANPILLLWKR